MNIDGITLVGLINKLSKKVGIKTADNIVAGMMIVHKDYFKLRMALIEYLQEYN